MTRSLLPAVLLALLLLAGGCSGAQVGEVGEAAEAGEVSSARTEAQPSEPAPTAAPSPEPTPEPASEEDDHEQHGQADPALPSAEELIEGTRAALEQWRDIADAHAAGFSSIGDAFTGWEHLVHPEWAVDGVILDPTRPESLVYRVEGEHRELVSAMYLLPPGSTMADVPDLGDERATWHIHDDLCFDEEGRLAGVFRDGACLFGGEHRVTSPMMHVWIVDHPCGPFAAIEGHGDVCDAGHDH